MFYFFDIVSSVFRNGRQLVSSVIGSVRFSTTLRPLSVRERSSFQTQVDRGLPSATKLDFSHIVVALIHGQFLLQ